ncbi:hypothetical protein BTO20_15830 [Mycobacterium dioxanotrophicus]|jgi:hypothetical protein|uniref:Uncharacterized protein n=1 Tax=Mycobacterium dioxanotrophicus TaxID=482462 RepID=A0A1Y0C3U4_9MYCO|nr:hypothetical protein [Mycobacterium dioxanotrophicus]ART69859.1 hypothetical protein BTO20_15830 [Mycobacterium dioxanotrophicus]
MSAGRRAALPPTSYRPPPRRDEHGEHPFRVTVHPENGRYAVDFNFAELPVSEVMLRWLVDRFVKATGPSGTYRTAASARMLMSSVRSFAIYLGSLEHPPEIPSELHGIHWDGWVLTTPLGSRKSHCGALRTLTKGCRELPADFFARAERTRAVAVAEKLQSYSPEEYRQIMAAAKTAVRAAVERVREGRAVLAAWRAGEIDQAHDGLRWQRGSFLDHIERHDRIPRYPCGRGHRGVLRHGGSLALFGQLYPTLWDMTAAAVLLVCLTGHNLSPILSLTADPHRPDGDGAGVRTALVDMLKPRRGPGRAHMTVALTDAGADGAGPIDVSSAFGVYQIISELSAPVRARSGSELLFGYVSPKGGTSFQPGLPLPAVGKWSQRLQRADAATKLAVPIDTRRLRMTWLQMHQRPLAHTEQTLANDYLVRNRGNIAEYRKVVADTLREQVTAARRHSQVQMMTGDQVARARSEPQVVAAEIGVAPEVLPPLIAGRLDTVLAGCVDFRGGPHSEAGEPCTASFLMCLSCPCARATPEHLPVIVAVHDRLHDKAREVTPLRWAQRFAAPVAQLADIIDRYSEAALDNARTQLSSEQRELVERFLSQALDHR